MARLSKEKIDENFWRKAKIENPNSSKVGILMYNILLCKYYLFVYRKKKHSKIHLLHCLNILQQER